MAKNRSFSICLTDIPKDRISKHKNGKLYLNLTSFDYNEPDQYGNHFSVSLPLTEKEKADKDKGKEVKRVFLGNGKIWQDTDNTQQATPEETDDLPF